MNLKPTEVMAGIAKLGDCPLSTKLLFVSQRILDMTTEDGIPLCDMSDVRRWFLECYHAQLSIEQTPQPPMLQQLGVRPSPERAPRDYTCPECGHEHEGKTECARYLGEGKFCHCEAKVLA